MIIFCPETHPYKYNVFSVQNILQYIPYGLRAGPVPSFRGLQVAGAGFFFAGKGVKNRVKSGIKIQKDKEKCEKSPKRKIFSKKIRKRFAGKEKVRIFAPRLREKQVLRNLSKSEIKIIDNTERKQRGKEERNRISLKNRNSRVFSSCDRLQFLALIGKTSSIEVTVLCGSTRRQLQRFTRERREERTEDA